MMELIDTNSPDQLEIHMSGKINADDYAAVLVPALESALSKCDRVRILAIMDPDVSFDPGAAWADMKMGLSHWRGFDRIAVSTDSGWTRTAVGMFAPLFPCPVRVFAASQTDDARRWLRESLGSMHIRDLEGDAIHIRLLGKLDPEAYDSAAENLDSRLRKRNGFRMLLDLRDFEGWEGISAISSHLGFAREHAPLVQKAAIVGSRSWQRMAERIGSRFLNAETRYFDAPEFDAAKAWLAE